MIVYLPLSIGSGIISEMNRYTVRNLSNKYNDTGQHKLRSLYILIKKCNLYKTSNIKNNLRKLIISQGFMDANDQKGCRTKKVVKVNFTKNMQLKKNWSDRCNIFFNFTDFRSMCDGGKYIIITIIFNM